jgi:hypothetical protein
MVELDLDEGQSPLLSLLQQAVYEDNLFKKFNAVDILISALDDDLRGITGANKMKLYLHKEVLSNEDYMRKLQLFSRIADNPETAIEYFGQDFLTHPEFHFDKAFQTKLSELNKRVNHFIGKLIKELSKGEEIDI